MHKKILLVEESDTTRNVAETVLRQHGFEVISVSQPDKAVEVVEFTRPDLIVCGAELIFAGDKTLFEKLNSDNKTAPIPKLLLADQNARLDIPVQIRIDRPLEPKSFLEKINSFTSGAAAPAIHANLLNAMDLEDQFIDEALGLDKIEVTNSEIMDKTFISKKAALLNEKSIGFETNSNSSNDESDTGRVESIIIDEDSTDIVQKPKDKVDMKNLTGKLDILSDQYGLSEPSELLPDDSASDHDYEWFINEMKNEAAGLNNPKKSISVEKTGEMNFTENSSIVDPVTPPPSNIEYQKSNSSGEGVDKFIQEFKKEVEKIHMDPPESMIIQESVISEQKKKPELSWEEKLENLTPDQLGLFTNQFSKDLAEKIAEKIIAKIDDVKLMTLIKNEIISQAKKNHF